MPKLQNKLDYILLNKHKLIAIDPGYGHCLDVIKNRRDKLEEHDIELIHDVYKELQVTSGH
jgi:hypothetical protein